MLKNLIAALNSTAWFNTSFFGESITVTPSGESPVSIAADVGEAEIEEVTDGRGKRRVETREIVLCIDPTADCGGVAASKLATAKVTYESVEYSVDQLLYKSDHEKIAKIKMMRSTPIDNTRPGLRDDRVQW